MSDPCGNCGGYNNPPTATDIIIEHSARGKSVIVLITRRNPPHLDKYALPGGFHERGLTLAENAIKEAKEETGLDIIIEGDPERPLCTHSNPSRDPRNHTIGVTYVARGYGRLEAGDDAKTAALYSIHEVSAMLGKDMFAFDHEKALVKYLRHLMKDLPPFNERGAYGRR
ncbi:TPA: NUDIX hydrolase [Candidatus Woesearchaeota archaeon]|nr:NUDIX hydrolase [Candidatus Woesearchaeota archaeon]